MTALNKFPVIYWIIKSLAYLYHNILFFWRSDVVVPTIWGCRLILPKHGFSRDYIFLFMLGLYELRWKKCFEALIRTAKIFIDIGAAADGFYSLKAYCLNSQIKIVSIEPLMSEFIWLTKNVYMNKMFDRILPLKLALGDRNGVLKINDEIVPLYRLDMLIKKLGLQRVDVIKIDVEGAGLGVIKGGYETIQRFRPVIFIEVHNKWEVKAIELLINQGYEKIRFSRGQFVMIPRKLHQDIK